MIPLAGRNIAGMPLARAAYPLGAWQPSDLGADLLEAWDTWDAARYTLNGGDYSSLAGLNSVVALDQTTAGKQPLQVTSAWNGNAIARHTRTNADLMNAASVAAFNTGANVGAGMFIVLNITAYSTLSYVGSHYGSTTRLENYINSTTNMVMQTRAAGSTNSTNVSFTIGTQFAVFSQVKNSGAREVWKNGTNIFTSAGTAPSASTHTGTSFGARFNDTFHVDAEFAHIGITKELDSTQIGDYFDWATAKFSL